MWDCFRGYENMDYRLYVGPMDTMLEGSPICTLITHGKIGVGIETNTMHLGSLLHSDSECTTLYIPIPIMKAPFVLEVLRHVILWVPSLFSDKVLSGKAID